MQALDHRAIQARVAVRMVSATVGLFLLLIAAPAWAQNGPVQVTPIRITAPWQLVLFPADDQDAAAAVSEFINVGYVPVGLEYQPGEGLYVLLVNDQDSEVGRWAIREHSDWNTLEDEITASIQDGFVPMDISRYGDVLAVLWVETSLPIDGWRISTSRRTPEDLAATMADFESRGYSLLGFSSHQDLMWYLFVERSVQVPARVLSYARDPDTIAAGLTAETDEGWMPNGIAIAGATLFVDFVR